MKTLVVYCSSHGTTEKAARLLRDKLNGETYLIDLKKEKLLVDINIYDAVIIGGSIHMGNVQGRIRTFIRKYHNEIVMKKVGLFLCCMREGDIAEEQFDRAFPTTVREVAVAKGIFGGEFIVSKMNYIEKIIVKKVSGTTEDVSKLDTDSIDQFARSFNTKKEYSFS
ncbi:MULTISPECIES: flavodoxin domain-containing protein [Bacillaceae]|uniref:Flavodoxin domain-containing protein n=1 Tax=Evansella alkalicola TaxID=745819 RepID=A0ABS6JRM7_9BACI|nr:MULTISPECIES: flavodoxin domain-containing protein [Bacillaceae]MBU9721223.1 flavodoxin domain-containing protein [Bacillus alkalicola]